ncbi:MAG TPA: TetR/AcrR family transcriptional regulator [Thermoleophilaceae bacterium]|nr:TetR/AcrR family transcriptional regulator [Thermoleophilaceae bacterium]
MTKAVDQGASRGSATATASGRTRQETIGLFLDAAERLLISSGAAAVTTRRLAAEAGLNHGLVHYYFGSVEEVELQVLERFTARLVERQRAMYAADAPFLEKWRTAMRYIDEDLEAGYPKVLAELWALTWNRPELRDRTANAWDAWRGVLTDAFERAIDEYGLDRDRYPVKALVTLVLTFNNGLLLERLTGMSEGHRELLDWIDNWLEDLERGKGRRG